MSNVTSMTWRAGICSVSHDGPVGSEPAQEVVVSDVTPSVFNGTYTVLACSELTCFVLMDDPEESYVSGGTIEVD